MRLTRAGHAARAAILTVLLVGGCAGGGVTSSVPSFATARAAAGSVTVEGGTGEFADCLKQAYWGPFAAETGIQVIAGPEISDDSRIKAMVETHHYDIDVEATSSSTVLSPDGPALFEPIDYSLIPRDQIVPGLALDYGVGFDPYALVLGYNTDKVGATHPTSWADYFDTAAFPGKRGMVDGFQGFLWALLADGVPADELIPLDIPRAERKLDSIKSELVFWQSGTQVQDLLRSGEVTMTDTFANRIASSRAAGDHVDLSWNGGFLVASDFLTVVKGNPNKDNAMALIAFVMRKDISGRLTDCASLAPGNKDATVNPDAAPYLATSHLAAPHLVMDDPAVATYLANNLDSINDAWLAWKAR